MDVHAAVFGDQGAVAFVIGADQGGEEAGDFVEGFRISTKHTGDELHAVGIP